jgi:general secretion pathway protein A
LVGLPELHDRLTLRRNRSLYSRIHRRLHVDPLVPDDTAEYVRELFAYDAVAMLHEATLGALRDIDRLATAALRVAARKKCKLVERDTIARVVEADARESA